MSARRWSQRSTKLPANGEMMIAGRLVKAKMSAYCVVEPVRWYDQIPRLKPVKPEPVSETSWPIHRSRKTSGRRTAGRESSLFRKRSCVFTEVAITSLPQAVYSHKNAQNRTSFFSKHWCLLCCFVALVCG